MRIVMGAVGHRFDSGGWLFRGVDLAFDAGRSYALTGPSGSGKSTLLGIIAGWIAPVEGSVDRGDVARSARVFQNPHGTPRRSARDHVALPLLARGASPREADEQADGWLERFGLGALGGRRFRDLSGGEAQRLMLARAAATSPDLLLVDEPTAQLDPSAADGVNLALNSLRLEHTIVVVATHDDRTRDACTDHVDLRAFAPEAVA
ncbi:ATP-binding cassette domain-containing protein [Microbacterium indicum]|uniref:ATP-binding cassette domain-containing protein n=1 Tax=Microbacterium indicum TaxID=358100 RepID=UPI00041CE2F0|nr:ATP-binding cassette domain-containing protein [Microbacterium indicum]